MSEPDDIKRDPRVVGPWAQKAASARARLVEVPEEAIPDFEPDYGFSVLKAQIAAEKAK